MSVIIRLQGLPWSASAINIRHFFQDLSIPDGGVHIVGGEKGDAFIAFSSDEDARRAMLLNGGKLNDGVIQLFLSSKTEMQSIIAVARGGSQPAPVPNMQPQRELPSQFSARGGSNMNNASGFNLSSQPYVDQPFQAQGGRDFPQSQKRESFSDIVPFQRDVGRSRFDNQSFGRQSNEKVGRNFEHPENRGFQENQFGEPFRGKDSFLGRESNLDNASFSDRNTFRDDRYYEDDYQGQGRSNLSSFGRRDDRNEGLRNDGPVLEPRNDFSARGLNERNFKDNSRMDNFPVDRNQGERFEFQQQNVSGEFGRFAQSGDDCDRGYFDTDVPFGSARDTRREFEQSNFSSDTRPWRSASSTNESQFSQYNNRGDPPRRDYDSEANGGETIREASQFVKASGMPWSVSYKDVRSFFGGLEIPRDGLKLINDKKGRRVGVAFIKFATVGYAISALKRSGQFMGDRYVDVRFCSQGKFESAIDSYVPDDVQLHFTKSARRERSRSPINRRESDIGDKTLIVKGLPQNTEKKAIIEFFSPLKIDSNCIHIDVDSDGKTKGSCYVEFPSSKVYKEALGYHRKTIHGKSVDIYPVSRSKMEAAIKSRKLSENNRAKGNNGKNDSNQSRRDSSDSKKGSLSAAKSVSSKNDTKYFCVKLVGLPFQVTLQDIKDFFQGLEIAKRGIHFPMKKGGSSSGVAFVEFVSSRDCAKALEKDREYIGTRYIAIKPIAKGDMLMEMKTIQDEDDFGNRFANQPSVGRFAKYSKPSYAGKKDSNMGKHGTVRVRINNVHFDATVEDLQDILREYHPVPNSVQLYYRDNGRPQGNASVDFDFADDAEAAIQDLTNQMLMGRSLYLSYA